MNHPVKIIVCGGRDYNDRAWLFDYLDRFHKRFYIALLMEGGQKGADRLAWQWAIERKVKYSEYKAAWEIYGKAAGPRRNQSMINNNPNAVIAFPRRAGIFGIGTLDITGRAFKANIPVYDSRVWQLIRAESPGALL